jgi:hypothetical protein
MPGTAYTSRQTVSRYDGLTLDAFNITIGDNASEIHSVTGNAYKFYVDPPSSTSAYALYGSYNRNQGQTLSGSYLALYGITGVGTGYVKFPTVYGYHTTGGYAMYMSPDGTLYTITSIRASKDIVPDKDFSNVVYGAEVVAFKYKIKQPDGSYISDPNAVTQPGCIAEQIEALDSSFCCYRDLANTPDKPRENPSPSVWTLEGIDYNKFICPMLKCIQDQKKEIDSARAVRAEDKALIDSLQEENLSQQSAINLMLQRLSTLESQCATLQSRVIALEQ